MNINCKKHEKLWWKWAPHSKDSEITKRFIIAIGCRWSIYLFYRWYKKDDNAVPPVYVLQRISTQLPDFISTNVDAKDKAKAIWWIDSDKMQDLLATTAEKCLGPEKARNYLVSG